MRHTALQRDSVQILCKFAADNGRPTAYSIVKGRKIPFTRKKILQAFPIADVSEEELSFINRVNEILSDS